MRHGMLAKLTFALALAAAVLAAPAVHADTTLKLASLAPAGSAWAKILTKAGKDMETSTQGRVKVQWFFSGQQGDEKDVVRKIKLGQIDGAALTAVGLGIIQPDVLVLDVPFLFDTDKQIDYVRDQMGPDFAKEFDTAGFSLLAWGDVGWTYLYTNQEIKKVEDLKSTKMWIWDLDPIIREFFHQLKMNGVPLGVPDVLPALQTGTIDGCYGAPLAAVALQWYTKVKYAMEVPTSYTIGALVVKKDVFEKLSAADQAEVRKVGVALTKDLTENVRKDNKRAVSAMSKAGVSFTKVSPDLLAALKQSGKDTIAQLIKDKKIPEALFAKVQKTVAATP